MAFIASIGSMVVDITVFTPRVPHRGENFVAHGVKMGPGGKGANAAAAFSTLGAQTLMVGKVGQDEFGQVLINALRERNVQVEGIEASAALQTGTAVVMVDDQRENTILVAMGANDHVNADYVRATLTPHAATLSAILVDFEIPEDGVAEAVRFGKQHNIPVIVDAGPPRPYSTATWAACTVLTPNEHETAAMVGYSIDADEDAHRAAKELLAKGPEMVVLKRGKRGALLMTATETLMYPVFPVDAVDTTGAGDSFTAMFTLAMIEGKSNAEALRMGNAAGAICASRPGTMSSLPNRADVEAFLAARR